MAQTISDLEKEREKILAAIDEHAKQFSSQRGDSNEATAHNLSDWLNAAEEVVTLSEEAKKPSLSLDKNKLVAERISERGAKASTRDTQEKKMKKDKQGNKSNAQAARSKASFFGVILMLCLLFTVIGVVYLAYVSFEKEMKLIQQTQQETLARFNTLEEKLTQLEKDFAAGGDSSALEAMTQRLDGLDETLAGLQHINSQATASNEMSDQLVNLEKRMNLRLTGLLKRLEGSEIKLEDTAPSTTENNMAGDFEVAEPLEPSEPKVPLVEQKVVKLVETKDAPDVAWLKKQNPEALVLQLASVPSTHIKDLEKQITDKKIQNAYIIPQKVNKTQTNYVLVVGSFEARVDANQAALELKKSTGMEAWVRSAKDLVNRLN